MARTPTEPIVIRIVPEQVTITRYHLYCEECDEQLAPADTQRQAEEWAAHHGKGFHGKKAVSG